MLVELELGRYSWASGVSSLQWFSASDGYATAQPVPEELCPRRLKRARSAEAFKLKVLNAMTAKSEGVAVRLRSQSPRRGRRPEGQPHYMLRDSEEDAKFAGKHPLLLQQLSRRWK